MHINRLSTFAKKNKPLFAATLCGLIYLLLSIFGFSNIHFGLQIFFPAMQYLPGITFPLATSYFNMQHLSHAYFRVFAHFIFSVSLYKIVVHIFAGEKLFYCGAIEAVIIGSFFYLVATKYLLAKKITFFQIIIGSLLSAIAALPYQFFKECGFNLGMAIFLWSIINGALLNFEYYISMKATGY